MSMKKIVLAIILIALVGGAAYFGWRLFARNEGGGTTPPPLLPPSPPIPTGSSPDAMRALTPSAVFAYWVNGATETLYYVTEEGQIMRAVLGGETQAVTNQRIDQLRSATPSPDGERVLVSFGAADRPFFSVFDIAESSWQPLPEGVTAAAWSPDGARLALLVHAGGEGTLNTFTLKDRTVKELVQLNIRGVELSWGAPDELFILERPSAKHFGSLWRFTFSGTTLLPVVQNQRGLMVRWWPGGATGIRFGYEENQLRLDTITSHGASLGKLPLVTLPTKCAFGNTMMYCGVPRELSLRDEWPDDYFSRKRYTEDNLFSWSSSTNAFSRIWEGDGLDVQEPLVRGAKLFFLNRYDRRVYEFLLPAPEPVRTEEDRGGDGLAP